MHIGVVGINHKLANVSLRETIAKACQRRFFLENPLKNGTFVLLSTCNRSELYFSAEDMVQAHSEILAILKEEITHEFEQKLYTFFGFDCFLHLAKVTTGLDSAIIAETEIQGQVKLAYEAAIALRSLCKELHFLFQKCLKVGKEMRTQYLFTKLLPDLEHALFLHAHEFFEGNLPSVLFVGTSEINLKIARFLKQQGTNDITFCNRSRASSLAISREMGCQVLEWEELTSKWHHFPWLICATKSPNYLLTEGQRCTKKRLLIDLSVPRNIDPRLEQGETILLNIDHLDQLLETRRRFLEEQLYTTEISLLNAVQRLTTTFRTRNQHFRDSEEMGSHRGYYQVR
ncbi:MAG: glutamyl-tRNA reductase [Verrucomicrobia bacterium]|nr:glutamyl-tRNA reductase [Verrucomicrobiota bacterium]